MKTFIEAIAGTVLEVRILIGDLQMQPGIGCGILEQAPADVRAVRIERSCPLPARSTVSPGLATSIARRIAARRSITTS